VNVVAGVAQLVEGCVLVSGVPEHDGVDDEAEGAELVFLSFSVALPELPPLAVEYRAGEGVAALGAVELGQDSASVGLVVEVGKQVKGFGDTPEFGNGAS